MRQLCIYLRECAEGRKSNLSHILFYVRELGGGGAKMFRLDYFFNVPKTFFFMFWWGIFGTIIFGLRGRKFLDASRGVTFLFECVSL